MKYVLKRLASLVMTLLLISLVTFFVFSVLPGDSVTTRLGTDATPEMEDALRKEWGLNDPVPVRYVKWLKGIVTGDLGTSYRYSLPVSDLLASRLTVTLGLGIESILLLVAFSFPIGILIARYGHTPGGRVGHVLLQLVMAVPPFFLGLLIIIIFGLGLHWFTPYQFIPASQSLLGYWASLLPAAAALSLPKIATVARFIRNGAMSEEKKDYVLTVQSKGADKGWIFRRHILKNAMIPVMTTIGMIAAEMLTGSIVVEQVFNLPGMGRFMVTSIGARDYPVVSAIMLYMAGTVVILNTCVDILYKVIDPRIGQ